MPSATKPLEDQPTQRSQFSSRLGFIIAAAGCAVGVGNIWSFPTQTAQNGGAAFVLVYLFFSFVLAYPALVAELTIGRYSQSNSVSALTGLDQRRWVQRIGLITSLLGLATLTLIYSFYSIVAGWFIGFTVSPVLKLAGIDAAANWLTSFNTPSTITLTLVFMAVTTLIVTAGVRQGIEKWCNRLMPSLFILLAVLIVFVLQKPGGMEGLKAYLLPDFSRIFDQKLLISALGQSFFSMSLGVGCMLVYGSYLKKQANLPLTAFQVAAVDSSVAFFAGLLIIPCMYVAMQQGVEIYNADGLLHSADTLVFTVLPSLFNQLGAIGHLVAVAFFVLLVIAALTSSISLIEPTVAWMVENRQFRRRRASWLITALASLLSIGIILNFDTLFGLAITLATQYFQPILCLMFAVYGSWIMRQDRLLKELSQGYPDIKEGWFWKIWPWYIRTVCPGLILLLFLSNL
ncbi:sodium-dependent transporter [Endozoicomonas sp. OPT23]|uniref:sodium-dependent transporter n=1 Tax=Endozoicomonas sp. OPT23 TaxID=2072845 RepID=UPI00129A18BC|nr:sodium-dependent transporter [Endozoicomonas sp. OPT23]MRI33563.1 sodium-dependent transporter [Endozoicomonas sp. OPT23]